MQRSSSFNTNRIDHIYQDLQSYLVRTGQHYDESMSQVFFRDLEMRNPDFNLSRLPGMRICGSGCELGTKGLTE
jgi:hypothetical protein